ncbi:MAG: radical SAM protein [Elusimicrobiota bacterium]
MTPQEKIITLKNMFSPCRLCARECGAKRLSGEIGACGAGREIKIASENLHFGEEPPISGEHGSGAIFFSFCSLDCCICQNYPISQMGNGREITLKELVGCMLSLQKRGAHNINFVTPTHYSSFVAEAVYYARQKGLNIPIVYNCGGYESAEVINLLNGFVDIYLPDAKYSDNRMAKKYSGIADYFEINKKVIKKMFEQAGNLVRDKNGIAKKGLIVRHLVLPNALENTEGVLKMLASISKEIFVSLMAQYHPAYKADDFKEINRRLTEEEYNRALELLDKYGLKNGWQQEM